MDERTCVAVDIIFLELSGKIPNFDIPGILFLQLHFPTIPGVKFMLAHSPP